MRYSGFYPDRYYKAIHLIEWQMQGQFKTYCIIGDPVYHSLSPGMQNAAFNSLGLNCTYISFRVPKDELKESVESLRATNVAGFNVTVPHKVEIIKYLDELDFTAEEAGAVNTVHNANGVLKGYNTDVYGFIQPLHRRKLNLHVSVLLLGAGGAARAVLAALSKENVVDVIIANRGLQRAEELAKRGERLGLKCKALPLDNVRQISANCGLIVNATSIGMNDEESVIDYEHITKGAIVYDIVYKPVNTNLIENAKYAGATVVYGYEMLLEQGAKAFEIWTGLEAPREVMKRNLIGIFGEPT